MIFDECHRAKKKYAYTEVADAYVEDSPHPMILGLTASPGADEETIRDVSDSLSAEHVEARTKDDPDIAPYVNEIEVEKRFVQLPDSHERVKKKLRSMLDWRLEKLHEAGFLTGIRTMPTRGTCWTPGTTSGTGCSSNSWT